MRSVLAGLRTLVLPWGAAPGSPRIVLGSQIPAELQTYYGGAVIAAILFYDSASSYVYEVVTTGGAFFIGSAAAGTVAESVVVSQSGAIGYWGFDSSAGVIVSMNGGPGSQLQVGSDTAFSIDGISAPRTYKSGVFATTSTGAIGAETAVHTIGSFTAKAGRAYRCEWRSAMTSSVAGNTAVYRIRRNAVGGTLLCGTFDYAMRGASSTFIQGTAYIRNNTGSDITDNLVLTLASAGGGTVTMGGFTTLPRVFRPRDVGDAADFSEAIQF